MARKARWTLSKVAAGFAEARLTSWKYFHDFITQQVLEFPHYVWRGQRDAAWVLETSLDRALRNAGHAHTARIAENHLAAFKLATRGRRGTNPPHLEENEWWSLAQHNGLATPLLDWTSSPFVALYFAFCEQSPSESNERAVWAIGGPDIARVNSLLHERFLGQTESAPTLDFIRPAQDENARLVAQSGVFTRTPVGMSVDSWVRNNLTESKGAALLKVRIPDAARSECMKALNRMNINHLSLFPDLYGAAVHCNTSLSIRRY